MLAELLCPPTVDRRAALAFCRGGRWRHWLRATRARLPRASRILCAAHPSPVERLETVWLPYFQLRVSRRATFEPPAAARPTAAQAPPAPTVLPATLLIGGHDGTPHWLDGATLANCRLADRHCDELFAPAISADDALALSRAAALRSRLTWATWRRTNSVEFTLDALLHYPFWAYYFAPRVGILDVRLWDGLTGRPAGAAVKSAWLACLAQGRLA